MKNLLLLFAELDIAPIIIFIIAIVIIIIKVISKVSNKVDQEELVRQHQQQSEARQAQPSGLTNSQRSYLEQLKERQRQRNQAAQGTVTPTVHPVGSDHDHVGQQTEQYDEIIGSLGDVSTEGCDELSGVRLIAHDLAYAPERENSVDYDKVARAMVLGEVLNSPRYKVPYISKRK
ncbi:MAG: hypothetical protein IJ492_02040 [Clostridia bacterium]|nr:hypothetical protein [Clostridia bacterium]MBQ8505022.1 hypothetical protein [Clostridia bacterium]